MKRDIDWKEISDGKLYSLNDMVKADCGARTVRPVVREWGSRLLWILMTVSG